MSDDGDDRQVSSPVEARYPALGREPRSFRSRKANVRSALALLAGIVVVVVLLALLA